MATNVRSSSGSWADLRHGLTKEPQAAGTSMAVASTYAVFGAGICGVHHFIANREFSAMLTVSVIVQCLAIALLVVQSHSSRMASGISARSLGLEALALVCRLSSTLFYNGYLPVDASGDAVFQVADLIALALVCWLLYRVLVLHSWSYQADQDTLPVLPVVVTCFFLAAVFHGNMNNRPLVDTLWMAGLFLGITAVLPQLWMISAKSGRIEALTSHYIAAMAVARVLSGIFMWYARYDITSTPWVEGFNHAPVAILAAHALHMVLLADFAYFYLRCAVQQGIAALDHVEVCTFV